MVAAITYNLKCLLVGRMGVIAKGCYLKLCRTVLRKLRSIRRKDPKDTQ
jgi:hypothetical protein